MRSKFQDFVAAALAACFIAAAEARAADLPGVG
jgi:hypothetical protein